MKFTGNFGAFYFGGLVFVALLVAFWLDNDHLEGVLAAALIWGLHHAFNTSGGDSDGKNGGD